ncbi:MAG: class I SAM-dependent methyltransferase [Thermoleophilia bacterium]|nr:class I SAM-dependent methyltransferase [Thermoleophilia bacterium]
MSDGTQGPDWSGKPAERCVWCGSSFSEAGTRRLFGRTACGSCATLTTDPVPSPESLEEAYGDWYWPETGQRFSLVGDAILRRSRAAMASRIDEVAPAGPILDVGAGEGTLLDALVARGRQMKGLERRSDHPSIENREIKELEGYGEFSGVVLWHSLEHMGQPRDIVTEAARLLRPGGFIFIAVPNHASLQSAAFGDDWIHLDLPRHLVHLTSDALTSGLEESGFEVTETSPTRAGQLVIGWLDGMVGRLPGGLNLYQSLRRRSARRIVISPGKRAAAIAAGVIFFPFALLATGIEIASGRPGTIYVEARRV